MEKENRDLLIKGALNFGIQLEDWMVEAFDLFLKELCKWNEKINLTSIRTEKEMVLKHLLDSLSVAPHLSKISSLLDIGSGAGFPGIPLKIIQPSLDVTLIDSVQKKVDFQRHIIRTLGLKGITAIHGRIQNREILERLEGRFDGTIARAFSDLDTLLLRSSPFLRRGGVVLAMRGKTSDEDLERLQPSTKVRYRLIKTATFLLPFSSIKRSIILFESQP